jgi:hypothetical protein
MCGRGGGALPEPASLIVTNHPSHGVLESIHVTSDYETRIDHERSPERGASERLSLFVCHLLTPDKRPFGDIASPTNSKILTTASWCGNQALPRLGSWQANLFTARCRTVRPGAGRFHTARAMLARSAVAAEEEARWPGWGSGIAGPEDQHARRWRSASSARQRAWWGHARNSHASDHRHQPTLVPPGAPHRPARSHAQGPAGMPRATTAAPAGTAALCEGREAGRLERARPREGPAPRSAGSSSLAEWS